MILFDLVRDHVNPAVRAVGKSELRLNFYIVIPLGKGVDYVYDGINATVNNEMIMHWERCNGI